MSPEIRNVKALASPASQEMVFYFICKMQTASHLAVMERYPLRVWKCYLLSLI